MPRKKKRLKLPNGFGGVRYLGDNRRKPYEARVTDGWDDEGVQKYRSLGTFTNERDALVALAIYNDDPCTLGTASLTFSEIYKMWYAKRFDGPDSKHGNSTASKASVAAAFKNSAALHSLQFYKIKFKDLQKVMDDCPLRKSSRNNMKTLWKEMWRYAMLQEVVKSNQAVDVDVDSHTADQDPKIKRSVFTDTEIQMLWDTLQNADIKHNEQVWEQAASVLILIYTGMRVSEMLQMNTSHIHFDERYMVGGLKTQAGKNRIIPIHNKILDILKRCAQGRSYLFQRQDGKPRQRDSYFKISWSPLMNQLGLSHLPHDCRYTCASRLDSAGANKLSTKRILGHADQDVTEHYTQKQISELLSAINLI